MSESTMETTAPLGLARKGFRGRIDAIAGADDASDLPSGELERRLVELGFTEGASDRSPARGRDRPRSDRGARQRRHDRAAPPRGDGRFW